MLTPEQVTEIEAAEKAATPGPWEPGYVWATAGVIFNDKRERVEDGTATHCAHCFVHGAPVWSGRADINGKVMPAHRHRDADPYEPEHLISAADGRHVAGNFDYEAGGILNAEDTAFICVARSAVPALLAEVRQLTEDRDQARHDLETMTASRDLWRSDVKDAEAAQTEAEAARDRALAELEQFKPQPMSQRCRDGHHNGVGDDRCIGCYCLCHSAEGDRDRARARAEQLHNRVVDLTALLSDRARLAEHMRRLAEYDAMTDADTSRDRDAVGGEV